MLKSSLWYYSHKIIPFNLEIIEKNNANPDVAKVQFSVTHTEGTPPPHPSYYRALRAPVASTLPSQLTAQHLTQTPESQL